MNAFEKIFGQLEVEAKTSIVPGSENKRVLKPLDLVKTPRGAFAIITERSGNDYSINFIGPSNGDHNAWWGPNDGLEYLDNLPKVLAVGMCHPFGNGRTAAEETFK